MVLRAPARFALGIELGKSRDAGAGCGQRQCLVRIGRRLGHDAIRAVRQLVDAPESSGAPEGLRCHACDLYTENLASDGEVTLRLEMEKDIVVSLDSSTTATKAIAWTREGVPVAPRRCDQAPRADRIVVLSGRGARTWPQVFTT